MKPDPRHRLKVEALWLFAIVAVAGGVEFLIILVLELDPMLSVRVQGFIGLLIIGYMIRMTARIISKSDKQTSAKNNGRDDVEFDSQKRGAE